MMPTVAIRADASIEIGSGHVMRTLELSGRLRDAGYRIIYLCRPYAGNLIALIKARGFDVRELPIEGDEAGQIGTALEQIKPFLLVIDHYGIDMRTEQLIRKAHPIPTFSYDDTFQDHCCDILINQNIYATPEAYRHKVPAAAKVLAGAEYSMIRGEFYRAREKPRSNAEDIRLLITLGVSDPKNITSKVLHSLKEYKAPLSITVVAGHGNQYKEELAKHCKALTHCRMLEDVTDMARFMHSSDIAITAAGQTTIEALFMELPTINIMIADNQRLISSYLQKQKLSISLTSDFSTAALLKALNDLTAGHAVTPEKLQEVSRRIGTSSVVHIINCLRFEGFSIEPTEAGDIRALFELTNDTEVRANSLSAEPIAWEEHQAWFANVMAEPLMLFYTLKDSAGKFMGQLRFDCRQKEMAIISISIVKEARGCGIASQIIRRGTALLFERAPERTVEAIIKHANPASLKSFKRAGFKKVRENTDTAILYLKKAEHETD
jgi:UDP-2,4-diacetamido-2,4,6-trideoxy-beta-L-altropyranose hydrolase